MLGAMSAVLSFFFVLNSVDMFIIYALDATLQFFFIRRLMQ